MLPGYFQHSRAPIQRPGASAIPRTPATSLIALKSTATPVASLSAQSAWPFWRRSGHCVCSPGHCQVNGICYKDRGDIRAHLLPITKKAQCRGLT